MFLKIKFYLSLILSVWMTTCLAQNLVSIKHYSTADGLSDNKITTVIKGKDGFMWFGSWAGISRFDGFNFLNYKSYPGDNSSLKSNRVDDLVEDKESGFLWAKTYDNQVYRFDKRTGLFTSVPELLNDNSLKGTQYIKILKVSNREVWLATADEGLILIEDAGGAKPRYKRFDKNQKGPYFLQAGNILFFHTDKRSNIWLVRSNGVQLLKKSNVGYHVSPVKALNGLTIKVADDGKNVTWYAVGGKIYSLRYDESQLKSYKLTDGEITGIKTSASGTSLFCSTSMGELVSITESGQITVLAKTKIPSRLNSIFESTDGNLWVQSEKYGTVLYHKKKGQLSELFPASTYKFSKAIGVSYSIYEDVNKIVWITLDGYGLQFYDHEHQRLQKVRVEEKLGSRKLSDVIFHTYYFSSGVVWVVGDKGGVDKVVFKQYDFSQKHIVPNSSIMIDNEVRGLFADQQNRLWLGTKGEKLMVFKDGVSIESPLIEPIPFNSGVYSIFRSKDGAMWFGTKGNGLFKAIPVDSTAHKYKLSNHYFEKTILKSGGSNSIYCIMQDRKGRLWAGSFGGGLVMFAPNGQILTLDNSFKNYPGGNYNRIRYLKEDAQGKIWIATTEGLVVFDPDVGRPLNYRFKTYKKQPGDIHSLGGNDIQFIYRDSRNQMWMLTSSGGLNLAIGENPMDSLTFQNFSTKDGLPSDFLLSCAEDDQRNLWIATQNGISKFSTTDKKHQNFNYFDGLSEEASFSESSGVRMPNGTMVFGNTQGFLKFDPSKIHSRKMAANLVFTSIQINGEDIRKVDSTFFKKDITFADRLTLDYNQNIITIDFAVLDFSSVDKQNYMCRILGFDDVWRSTDKQRKITYTNLPPGKYEFQVKSSNDELYNPIPFRTLKITIKPPLWKTWWAYTLYIIIAIAVLLLIQRVIYIMLKLRHGIALEKKMAELKLDFFTQISHELRTPLTLIVNPIGEVLRNENLSGKGKRYVKLVLKNAKRMTRLINQILDLRKVQSGKATLQLQTVEVVSFVNSLVSYFEEVIDARNLKVEIVSAARHLPAHWDIEKIEIILYNILANAIKFSPDGGKIIINITEHRADKICRIEVSDEGPGVLQEELDKIFNIYYEGEHKAAVKGSGIGLALAKELVILHRGNILAQNNTPKGLKIIIDLERFLETPTLENAVNFEIGDSILEKEVDQSEADLTLEADTKDSKRPLVLVVEDNVELRSFLADKFSDRFRVETAGNGEEGLEKATDLQPDLILSDVMMPKMDGMEMLVKLKANSLTSHIPVILLTAKNTIESHIMGLKFGADYYLPKPFDMQLLSAAIDSILKQRKKFFQAIVDGEEILEDELSIADKLSITDEDKEFLEKTIQIVKERLEDRDFNIDTVADLMNMSRSAFFKKFKSLTNLAPVEFVRDTRLEAGKQMLESGSKNISEIAYSIGFNNPKYFSTCFKAKYGTSPKEYVVKN